MGLERTPKHKQQRRDPLHVALSRDASSEVQGKPQRAKFADREQRRKAAEASSSAMEDKVSKKIMELAREQQVEMASDEEDDYLNDDDNTMRASFKPAGVDSDDDEELGNDEDEYEELELDVDAEDEVILQRFLPSTRPQRQTLADMIMEKIRQHEATAGQSTDGTGHPADHIPDVDVDEALPLPSSLPDKVVQVYTQVGQLLSKYRSGKLPKAFKIIPSLNNWAEILYITQPEKWTPHATFAATRVFASNLKSRQTQKFYEWVLLERVRADIAENRKLNYHLFMALKKSLYKPAAFFKGILFPLCESGGCTLREAAIFGSILSRVSIPMLHSAAALLRLAEMSYTGPNSVFIRVLLDKKYALPFRVVAAIVDHFVQFRDEDGRMPVLWHQSLLVFCQRYRGDLSKDQLNQLMELIRIQSHPSISPEIRRELVHAAKDISGASETADVDMM